MSGAHQEASWTIFACMEAPEALLHLSNAENEGFTDISQN